MSQDCQRFQDLLPLYAFEALEEAEALEVQQHIQRCEACRREAADHRKLFWAMRIASAPEATPEQVERVTAGVYRRIKRHQIAVFAFRAAAALAAAACLVLVLRHAWSGKGSVPPSLEQPVAEAGVPGTQVVPAEQLGAASREPTDAQVPQEEIAGQDTVPELPRPALPALQPRTPEQEWGEVVKIRTAFWALKARRPTSGTQESIEGIALKERLTSISRILKIAEALYAEASVPEARLEALKVVYHCYWELGKPEREREAIADYVKLLEELKGKREADLFLQSHANYKFHEKNFPAAVEYYGWLVERGPDPALLAYVHYRAGGIHAAQRRPWLAIEELKLVLRQPNCHDIKVAACTKAVELLTNMKEYERAVLLLGRFEQGNELSAEEKGTFHIQRGVIHMLSKQSATALKAFRAAMTSPGASDDLVLTARNYRSLLNRRELQFLD